MPYRPLVTSMNPLGRELLTDRYTAVLFDQIESAGSIGYAYIVAVYDTVSDEPVYFVTSEFNAMASTSDSGSHFLCAFEDDRHVNMGASDDWGEATLFFPEALRRATDWVAQHGSAGPLAD